MREFLRKQLADWQDDLPQAWQEVFANAQADFGAVPNDIEIPQRVFPLARARAASIDRHLLRAFEHIEPANVRVILIGQDPYPDENRATGRAFDDGAAVNVTDTTSPSLKLIVQSAASLCLHRAELAGNAAGWDTIRAELALPSMAEMFDGLAAQGVLFINAAWTFTGKGQRHLNAHLGLWRPVNCLMIQRLLEVDADRVVLAIGSKARDLVNRCNHIPPHFVHHAHPQARSNGWFALPNPFAEANLKLAEMELAPVCWLPGLTCPWPRNPA